MYWHIDTDIIALLVMAALFVYYTIAFRKRRNLRAPQQSLWFLRCIYTGMIATLIDIIASLQMEHPSSAVVLSFWMILYFISMILLIVVWFCYVLSMLYPAQGRGYRILKRLAFGAFGVYALYCALTPLTGHIFSVSADGVYQRGPLFFASYTVFAVYAVALFAVIAAKGGAVRHTYPALLMLSMPLITAVFLVAQLLLPGLLLIMPGYMVCLVFAFLFLQQMHERENSDLLQSMSEVAMSDRLTGLYNRMGMETAALRVWSAKENHACLLLIADLDNLKTVNDTKGHPAGDRALQTTAACLSECFQGADAIVRYGGDEFLVLLTDPPRHDGVVRILQDFSSRLARPRSDNDSLPLQCSVGAVYGIAGQEPFSVLCNRADVALYSVKRHGKNGFAFYTAEMERGEFPA